MEHTQHTFLVGDQATQFAIQMGFKEQSLTSNESQQAWTNWRSNNCQPNSWKNVIPDPTQSCGPYRPIQLNKKGGFQTAAEVSSNVIDETNHDTIGMIAIDSQGRIAAGTSTNGKKFKIPG